MIRSITTYLFCGMILCASLTSSVMGQYGPPWTDPNEISVATVGGCGDGDTCTDNVVVSGKNITLADDDNIFLGASSDFICSWDTGQTIDTMVCGITGNGPLLLMQAADIAVDWDVPSLAGEPGIIVAEADESTKGWMGMYFIGGLPALVGSDQGIVLGPSSSFTESSTVDYGLVTAATLNDTGAPDATESFLGLGVNITNTDSTGWNTTRLMSLSIDNFPNFFVDFDSNLTIQRNANSAKTTIQTKIQTLTFSGGAGDASQVTNTTLIPDGVTLLGISTKVTTAGTTCTTMDIGDGVDADLFGDEQAVTLNATTDNVDVTANFGNPVLSNTEVTITASAGGNCVSMVIVVTSHFIDVTF